MSTISDLLTDALAEIRSARAGDVVGPDDMDFALRTLNRLLDARNARDRAVYANTYTDFTLTGSLSPHTIGPGGTFDVTQRPESLSAAAVNLGGSPALYRPITVRDAAWYAAQPIPALTNAYPSDVYYEGAWPLGKLYFWPVPTTAYAIRLWTRTLFTAVALTDTFSLPPGYQDELTLTLAEYLAPAFGQSVSQSTATRAREARALVWGNNDEEPRLATCDAGLSRGGSGGAVGVAALTAFGIGFDDGGFDA